MDSRKGDIIHPHIRAWRTECLRKTINITILKEIVGVRTCFVEGMHYVEVDEGEPSPIALTLTPTLAQKLMDDLWDCGVRPSEGSGSSGSLRATEKHLQDMRKIAFDRLKIKTESGVNHEES